MTSYYLFQCPWGFGALGWTPKGVSSLLWPEETKTALRRRMRELGLPLTATAPRFILRLEEQLKAYSAGEPADFGDTPLDLSDLSAFQQEVLSALFLVKRGETVSYADLARRIGKPGAARAVGRVMATNPLPIVIPCHRVVAANGKIGGFSAPGGCETKWKLLLLEGRGDAVSPPELPKSGGLPYSLLEASAFLRKADPQLGRIIRRVGPCRLVRESLQSTFSTLMETIIYQQLTAKAAQTITARVRALFSGAGAPTPRQLLYASEEALRACGLSGAKVAALKDLAQKTLEGSVPDVPQLERMKDEDIISRLTQIRGIGRWTVEMLLIFRLGRPDVFAVDDYGLRKGLAVAHQLPDLPGKKQMAEIGKRWSPFRSVASWYLWRANELESPRRKKS